MKTTKTWRKNNRVILENSSHQIKESLRTHLSNFSTLKYFIRIFLICLINLTQPIIKIYKVIMINSNNTKKKNIWGPILIEKLNKNFLFPENIKISRYTLPLNNFNALSLYSHKSNCFLSLQLQDLTFRNHYYVLKAYN